MGVFAPTGTGKTYLWSRGLAPLWTHTMMFDAKCGDPDNRRHAAALGAKIVKRYPAPDLSRWWGGDPYPERHYWLEPDEAEIPIEFARGFSHIYHQHKKAIRVIGVDEFKLTAARPPDGFGHYAWTNRMLRFARGREITFVGMTQSPWWIGPGGSDLFTMPRWHWIGRTVDERSLDRYREISGLPKAVIYEVIPSLAKHEWLLIALDHDIIVRTTLPGPNQLRRRAA